MFEFDKKYFSKFNIVAGVDEAGRGPLAGPVVASAVIYDSSIYIEGVDDSKKISQKKREVYYKEIMSKAKHVGVGIVFQEEIDKINILNATKEAMRKAIQNLTVKPELVLVDGNQIEFSDYNQESIVKGDAKSFSIASASIVAKVTRDRIMENYSKLLPEYGFENHKGYGTKKHLEAISAYRSSIIHRKSFKPISEHMPTFDYYFKNKAVDRLLIQIAGDYLIKNGYVIVESNFPYLKVSIDNEDHAYMIKSNIDMGLTDISDRSLPEKHKIINVEIQNGKFKIVIKDIN